MPGRLQDKIAVITGSSSGLGRAIALAYASEGAQLVLSDIREESLSQSASGEQSTTTLDAVKEKGAKALFVKCDTTKAEDVEALVRKAAEWGGRVDIMVNNAGRSSEKYKSFTSSH
jgi:NAD(P)-dependent dehydrogenase (short-subunit alcohol dehydrogenase family)